MNLTEVLTHWNERKAEFSVDMLPETAKDFLVTAIPIYKNQTGRPYTDISKSTGVKYNTLMSIIDPSTKSKVSDTVAGPLIAEVTPDSIALEVVTHYLPFLKKVEENLSKRLGVENYIQNSEVDRQLDEYLEYLVYSKCSLYDGMADHLLRDDLGQPAVLAAERLTELGLLEKDSSYKDGPVFRTTSTNYRTFNVQSLYKRISHLARYGQFAQNTEDKDKLNLGVIVDCFDEDGQKAIKQKYREFIETVKANRLDETKSNKTGTGMYICVFTGEI